MHFSFVCAAPCHQYLQSHPQSLDSKSSKYAHVLLGSTYKIRKNLMHLKLFFPNVFAKRWKLVNTPEKLLIMKHAVWFVLWLGWLCCFAGKHSEHTASVWGKMNLAPYLSLWTAKLVFVAQTTLSLSVCLSLTCPPSLSLFLSFAVENDQNKRKQQKE